MYGLQVTAVSGLYSLKKVDIAAGDHDGGVHAAIIHCGCARNVMRPTYISGTQNIYFGCAAMVNVLRPGNRLPSRNTNKANHTIVLNCTLYTGAGT